MATLNMKITTMNPQTTVNLELSDEDSKCIDPENVRKLYKAMVEDVLGNRTLTEFKDGEVDIKICNTDIPIDEENV